MILAIEAAVAGGSLSLSSAGSPLAGWVGDSNVSRAEDLLPAIQAMLSKGESSASDISMIAVAAGPGSFTGIRIGLSTALGLSTGLRIPMASVSILRAMAAAAVSENASTLAAVPMGRSSVCIQRFAGGSPVTEPETLHEVEFQDLIDGTSETIVIHEALAMHCGNAADVLNLGGNLAHGVGAFVAANPQHREDPRFVAKSF